MQNHPNEGRFDAVQNNIALAKVALVAPNCLFPIVYTVNMKIYLFRKKIEHNRVTELFRGYFCPLNQYHITFRFYSSAALR